MITGPRGPWGSTMSNAKKPRLVHKNRSANVPFASRPLTPGAVEGSSYASVVKLGPESDEEEVASHPTHRRGTSAMR